MAEGLNRVTLIGNLGADPELKFTQGSQAVLKLRLATTESYLNKARERQERTEWHTVIIWGNRGEALNKILSKGGRICVEGRIQYRQWDDKEGHKRYATDIVATNVVLLGGPRGSSAGGSGGGGYGESGGRGGDSGAPPDDMPVDEGGGGGGDDIPF